MVKVLLYTPILSDAEQVLPFTVTVHWNTVFDELKSATLIIVLVSSVIILPPPATTTDQRPSPCTGEMASSVVVG